jgi:hypothetical protein
LRTEAGEVGQQHEGGDAVQYDQKGHTPTCVTIALPLQKEGINADDIEFFSKVGRGFYRHRGPHA